MRKLFLRKRMINIRVKQGKNTDTCSKEIIKPVTLNKYITCIIYCYYMASSARWHIIDPLLTKFARSRWLDIGLVLFFASLLTSTSSRSINTQKKNLANIQKSWPHTWSITHTYMVNLPLIKFSNVSRPGHAVFVCLFLLYESLNI